MKKLPSLTICFLLLLIFAARPAFAASLYLNGPSSGQNVTLSVGIDTAGVAEYVYDVTVTYSGQVVSVSASTTGGICTQTVSAGQTSPSTVRIQCGTSRPGFTGRGTIGTISAVLAGDATFQISSATIYNGPGTLDTVSSTGSPVHISNAPVQTTQAPTGTQVQGTPTPAPHVTSVQGTSPGSLSPKSTPKPTVTTANQPSVVVITQPPYPTSKTTPKSGSTKTLILTPTAENLSTMIRGYFNNSVLILLFILPIIILLILVALMSFRMFQMMKRRQREIELLFEHELGELAVLESKMDVLDEKGGKGKQEFRDEFERTKDQLLKEIKPDYIGIGEDKKPEEEESRLK